MKVLEIVAHEQKIGIGSGTISAESTTQITNIIQHLEGNISQDQTGRKEVRMKGDKFENISQSMIATRGAIAKGVIAVRERHGDDIADAFKVLEAALGGESGGLLPEKDRKEALEL